MGEVYRARDTKLDRDVAIKILPAGLAADPERLSRFEREAKTLASLNHSNIAHIYGVEGAGSTRAIVMELVEGEDLSHPIGRGQWRCVRLWRLRVRSPRRYRRPTTMASSIVISSLPTSR